MAKSWRVPFSKAILYVLFPLSCLYLFAPLVLKLTEPVETDVAHPAIKESALFPVLAWCNFWPFAFARQLVKGQEVSRAFLAIRFGWATGCLLLMLHIAIAFHLGHGWSHEAAWEHTHQASGYGDGIYMNYAFVLVWFADAMWACIAIDSYLARSRWLHWTIHGFIAFIVFNAAVVFGSPSSQTLYYCLAPVLLWPLLLVLWRQRRRVQQRGEEAPPIKPGQQPNRVKP
jgi:hypothetical protein